MSEEKKVNSPQEDYKNKIESLLSQVTSGVPEIAPTPKEPTTYEKMKSMGGVTIGLEKLFKLDESEFDIPHYLTEEDNEQIVGTKLFKVKPPSNYPDADEYWNRVSPFLKRIGAKVPHVSEVGFLDMTVVTSKGEEEVLRVQLVRDEASGDKPTLTFEYINGPEITSDEVFKFIGRVGLRADRVSAQQLQGMIVLDVLEK